MRLVRLELKNFRQHCDTAIDFRDGMTAIVGANGSGKSTILEAITYALYGEQRDNKDTIRFHWATGKKFSVRLRFELDGKRLEVERTNDSAALRQLGEPKRTLTTGLKEVSKACERMLALNYDQFVNSFCAEQKGLAFLQFKSNAVRQEEVARMLGFDRLKRAEELAGQRRRDTAVRRDALERTLGDEAVLRAERTEAIDQIAAADIQLTAARQRETDVRAEIEPLAARREQAEEWLDLTSRMAAIRSEAEGLKKAVELTDRQFEEASAQVAEFQLVAPAETEYRGLETRLREFSAQREAEQRRSVLTVERDRLEVEIAELEAAAKAIDAEALTRETARFEAIRRSLSEAEAAARVAERAWSEAQTQARTALATATADVEHARAALAKAEAMLQRGQCPECGQPIGEGFRDGLDRHRTTLLAVEAAEASARATVEAAKLAPPAVNAANEAIANAKRDLGAAQTSLDEARIADARLAQIRNSLQIKQGRRVGLAAELAAEPSGYDPAAHAIAESRAAELKPKHERFLAIREAPQVLETRKAAQDQAANLNAAKERYRTGEAARTALGFENAEVAHQTVEAHRTLTAELPLIAQQIRMVGDLRTQAEGRRTAVESRLAEFREKLAERKRLQDAEVVFDTIAREFKALRLELNRTLGPELAARASENLSLLTNGRYPTLELDSTFAASLMDDGIAKPVISGGEADVVALALRLALSELIQERQGCPMSLLVLDEVFGSLDADRRQSVLDRLTALKGRFEQILVISHIEEINQVADQCVYVTRDPITRSAVVSDAPPGGFGELL